MRDEFVRVLSELAAADRNVVLITGDLGFGVLTEFAKRFPDQYVNAGVAEQNMTGLAVGMALEGKVVFTYSIANFPTLRCLEQIRNDAAYHRANVKIVAIGGGFSYGALGMSHHATEDLAIMRAIPNLAVIAPGDPFEVAVATRAVYKHQGACYLRLGRGGEPRVHASEPEFTIGTAIRVLDGEDVAILSTGGMLATAKLACDELATKGMKTALYSVPTLKPFDEPLIADLARKVSRIVTVEEHTSIGGLAGAASEVIARIPGERAALRSVALSDKFSTTVGSQQYLRDLYGLSLESIVQACTS